MWYRSSVAGAPADPGRSCRRRRLQRRRRRPPAACRPGAASPPSAALSSIGGWKEWQIRFKWISQWCFSMGFQEIRWLKHDQNAKGNKDQQLTVIITKPWDQAFLNCCQGSSAHILVPQPKNELLKATHSLPRRGQRQKQPQLGRWRRQEPVPGQRQGHYGHRQPWTEPEQVSSFFGQFRPILCEKNGWLRTAFWFNLILNLPIWNNTLNQVYRDLVHRHQDHRERQLWRGLPS